jgi:hypothetical protein
MSDKEIFKCLSICSLAAIFKLLRFIKSKKSALTQQYPVGKKRANIGRKPETKGFF